MCEWKVSDKIKLRIVQSDDAAELFSLIDNNREQLSKYLPWTNLTKEVEDEEKFLEHCQESYEAGSLWPATILIDGKVSGMFDFHNFNSRCQNCEIGYWLGKAYQHNGVMTKVVKRAIKIGFEELHLHKIKLLAEVENTASNNVAKRCGLELEGVLRDEIFSDDTFHDANLYGILK